MARKHFLLAGVIAGIVVLFIAVAPLHAQNASAVFNGPQNMDQGLQTGLNNITPHYITLGQWERNMMTPSPRRLRPLAEFLTLRPDLPDEG